MQYRKLPYAKTGTDDTLHEFKETNDHFLVELSIGTWWMRKLDEKYGRKSKAIPGARQCEEKYEGSQD